MTTGHLYDPPYALWTIWRALSTLNRGLVVSLAAVFVYCIFSTIRTMLRLHSVWNRANQDRKTVSDAIAALATRYTRMRQVISAAFYLFGFVLFLGLESITNVLGDGKDLSESTSWTTSCSCARSPPISFSYSLCSIPSNGLEVLYWTHSRNVSVRVLSCKSS